MGSTRTGRDRQAGIDGPLGRFPIALATTLRRNNSRRTGERRGAFQRSNTTRRATRWAKGVQKWREPAVYSQKPTVGSSVSACFAVRYRGANLRRVLDKGDLDGYAVWKRILRAVEELQGTEPKPGEAVH